MSKKRIVFAVFAALTMLAATAVAKPVREKTSTDSLKNNIEDLNSKITSVGEEISSLEMFLLGLALAILWPILVVIFVVVAILTGEKPCIPPLPI
ncbi:MAG: hypothetical protein V5A64_01575 [Candidatus Thermoplasmatota archaeon]